MEAESPVEFGQLTLREAITKESLDFNGWTGLISEIGKTYPDDIETIGLLYDSFLSKFPLCYGYWRRYVAEVARLCPIDKVIEVFERAVESATYSVDMWVDYCSFGMLAFEDAYDVRRLFKRGMSFVGKDYLCYSLWDKYIEFEYSHKDWTFHAHVCIQALKFPTRKLHCYYERFKKLVALMEEELACQNMEVQLQALTDCEVAKYKDISIFQVIEDLRDTSNPHRGNALQRFLSIGQWFYGKACQLEEKIHCFETSIQRPYFHVKSLELSELENWHQYLDFIEMHGDFDWAVKLYERCLIPCANYPEFWMRYVEFVETNGGRELANFALDRATKIFLKSLPSVHIFNARFKEQIGDPVGARLAYDHANAESDYNFVENVVKEANMEKRMGNIAAAAAVYRKALERAAEKQNLDALSTLYVHFARLDYLVTGHVDAAIDILMDGIQHVRHSKSLLEGLINFLMMHGEARHINVIDSIISSALTPGLDVTQGLRPEEREHISILYLEFVDLYGTIYDIRRSWSRHVKLFPHSMRSISYENHNSDNQPSRMAMKGDCSVQIQMQEKKQAVARDHDFHSDQDIMDKSEEANTNHHDLVHEAGKDESTGTSKKRNKSEAKTKKDHESEENMKFLSVESLSIHPRENDIQVLNTQENSRTNRSILGNRHNSSGKTPSISSPISTQPGDSTEKIHNDYLDTPSLTSHEKPASIQKHSQHQHYQPAEMSSKLHIHQNYPQSFMSSQNPQFLQQQKLQSLPSASVTHSEAQMSQYYRLSNGQQGGNEESGNQWDNDMCHYYYYYQLQQWDQQIILQQQQQQQQQQKPQQPQQQQCHQQQQLLQQQYKHQELQSQQYYLQQQHLQQQQRQLQQQNQQQPQEEKHQHIFHSQAQAWSREYHQQGGVVSPGSADASGPASSPKPKQRSPQTK